jgi:hypothetical protein
MSNPTSESTCLARAAFYQIEEDDNERIAIGRSGSMGYRAALREIATGLMAQFTGKSCLIILMV